MTGTPVTYEVNLVPDPSIEAAFDAWLDEHVSEMLRLPGFLTAVVRYKRRGVKWMDAVYMGSLHERAAYAITAQAYK